MNIQLTKTNSKGFSHIVALLAVIVLFGIAGTYFIVASKAATTATVLKTGQLSSFLKNGAGQVMCLDLYKNLSANGTPINIFPCSTTDAAQKFSLYSDNSIRIHGKCLDVYQNQTANGTKIELFDCNGNANQKWHVGTDPKQSLNNLISNSSGKCLDVYSSQTANNSKTNLWGCNGTTAQVWGWNTNGKIIQGGTTYNANCHSSVIGGNTCYYWVGANQNNNGNFSASGVSATMNQPNPYINPQQPSDDPLHHSIFEIWAGSPDNKQVVEIGWYKDVNRPIPILFATAWVNSEFIGYAQNGGTGFVPVSTSFHVGDQVSVGSTGNYKILFANNQWQIWYNNQEIGYFPESVWTSRGATFNSIGWVSPYGEVEDSVATIAKTDMGNGTLGSNTGSSAITAYTLYGSSTPAQLTNYYQPTGLAASYYNYGNPTATSFRVGGPAL